MYSPKNLKNYFSRYVPIIIIILSIWIMSLIPFKILSHGYIPKDDALRHAAKAVCGKDWNQILVLRDDIKMDSHVGWHIILRAIYKITKIDTFGLVIFSVASLFILFSITGIMLLRRPEALPAALLVICIANAGLLYRLLLGRPFMVTMSAIFAIGLLWPKLKEKEFFPETFALITLLIAAATWIHCGWYLFILPIACFFAAREWRAGLRITIAFIAGVAIGAVATGHPMMLLRQTIEHLFLAFSNNPLQKMLVTEFQPFGGDVLTITAIVIILMLRGLRGKWDRKVIEDPIFILAVSSWALGFVTTRAWIDLGIPAVILILVREFQDFFEEKMEYFSWNRVALAAICLCVFYLSITNDLGNRWSNMHPTGYLSLEKPEHAKWLPEPGGIFYTDNMDLFYETFYRNPNAPWRYILGFEPALMPKKDFDTYRNIQRMGFACTAFAPWVKKMKPQDRLIILNPPNQKPDIPELEWHNIPDIIWVGRLPRMQNKVSSDQKKHD